MGSCAGGNPAEDPLTAPDDPAPEREPRSSPRPAVGVAGATTPNRLTPARPFPVYPDTLRPPSGAAVPPAPSSTNFGLSRDVPAKARKSAEERARARKRKAEERAERRRSRAEAAAGKQKQKRPKRSAGAARHAARHEEEAPPSGPRARAVAELPGPPGPEARSWKTLAVVVAAALATAMFVAAVLSTAGR